MTGMKELWMLLKKAVPGVDGGGAGVEKGCGAGTAGEADEEK